MDGNLTQILFSQCFSKIFGAFLKFFLRVHLLQLTLLSLSKDSQENSLWAKGNYDYPLIRCSIFDNLQCRYWLFAISARSLVIKLAILQLFGHSLLYWVDKNVQVYFSQKCRLHNGHCYGKHLHNANMGLNKVASIIQ